MRRCCSVSRHCPWGCRRNKRPLRLPWIPWPADALHNRDCTTSLLEEHEAIVALVVVFVAELQKTKTSADASPDIVALVDGLLQCVVSGWLWLTV